MKQAPIKQLIIEQLKKTPIVQVACSKSGIGRSTFYRWRQEDNKFRKLTDQALLESIGLMNDVAESQLINLVKEKNLGAIMYWLRHRHPAYGNKLEIINGAREIRNKLTPMETKLLNKALRLSQGKHAGLIAPPKYEEKIKEPEKNDDDRDKIMALANELKKGDKIQITNQN